jgi:hypothetical protein
LYQSSGAPAQNVVAISKAWGVNVQAIKYGTKGKPSAPATQTRGEAEAAATSTGTSKSTTPATGRSETDVAVQSILSEMAPLDDEIPPIGFKKRDRGSAACNIREPIPPRPDMRHLVSLFPHDRNCRTPDQCASLRTKELKKGETWAISPDWNVARPVHRDPDAVQICRAPRVVSKNGLQRLQKGIDYPTELALGDPEDHLTYAGKCHLEYQNECTKLRHVDASKKKVADALNLPIAQAGEAIRCFDKEFTAAHKHLADLRSTFIVASSRVTKMAIQLAAWQRLSAILYIEREELKEELAQQTALVMDPVTADELQRLRGSDTTYAQQVADLKGSVVQLEAELKIETDSLDDAGIEIGKLEKDHEILNKEHTRLESKLTTVQDELKTTKLALTQSRLRETEMKSRLDKRLQGSTLGNVGVTPPSTPQSAAMPPPAATPSPGDRFRNKRRRADKDSSSSS